MKLSFAHAPGSTAFATLSRSLLISALAAAAASLASGCTGRVPEASNTLQPGSPNAPESNGLGTSTNSPTVTGATTGAGTPGGTTTVSPTTTAPTGARGILGCPTQPLPTYAGGAVAELSTPFARSCATCHGTAGEGSAVGAALYPSIPGKLAKADYIAKVRAGVNSMPQFGADFISDAELSADFDALVQRANQPGQSAGATGGPSTWTEAETQAIYEKGLAVWRKPGSLDGQACTNCHSADGVELAVIGFTDDAILRRGQQHLAPEDALTVRDFIHAQRRRLGIQEVCSTDWRPFQPGGTVLPGNTPDEQDASFLHELEQQKLLLATGTITTLEDAQRAFAELQAVDLRQLPLGIPLPRFAEDKFNGPEHRDINDYMPPVPTAPNDPQAYFALEDAYLADPTDARLYALLDENRTKMNDLGYAAKNTTPKLPGNCSFNNSTEWILTRISQPKRLSVLVAAHLFREELKKPGSFYARPASPFPAAPVAANPAFFLGGFAVEPPCYDNNNYPEWIASFPEGFRAEFPEIDLASGVVNNATDRLTHVWMTLGQVMDPTLIATDQMQNNKLHYWAFRNFKQREVHLPFLYTHRIASLTTYWQKMRGTPQFPVVSGPFNKAGTDWLHPLLATENQNSAGLQSAVDPESTTLPGVAVDRFKGNLLRMMLLIDRDLLKSGMALQTDQNYDHCLGITCQLEQMRGYFDGLKQFAGTPNGLRALTAQGFDLALYEADTRALLEEVITLAAAAPRR